MWPFDRARFNQLFASHAERTQVSRLKAHPYALRHGGASHDAFFRRRELGAIQLRGRWAAEASVRRYNKHAKLLAEVQALPEATRKYGQEVVDNLDAYIGKRRRPRPPPLLPGGLAAKGAKRKLR